MSEAQRLKALEDENRRLLLADGRALPSARGSATPYAPTDEALYILESEITLIAGDKKVTAKAGSLAYIPAGCVHSFRVEADHTRLLNFYFPGGFEKVVAEFGVAATSRTLPPAELQQRGMSPVVLPDSLRDPKSL